RVDGGAQTEAVVLVSQPPAGLRGGLEGDAARVGESVADDEPRGRELLFRRLLAEVQENSPRLRVRRQHRAGVAQALEDELAPSQQRRHRRERLGGQTQREEDPWGWDPRGVQEEQQVVARR